MFFEINWQGAVPDVHTDVLNLNINKYFVLQQPVWAFALGNMVDTADYIGAAVYLMYLLLQEDNG